MNELTYTMVGDYSLPNLKLPQQPEVTLGRYAQMRRKFLKEHHRVLYYNLLTRGELTQHLAEVEQRASKMEETILSQMAQKEGVTEQMKAEDMTMKCHHSFIKNLPLCLTTRLKEQRKKGLNWKEKNCVSVKLGKQE